MNKSETKVARHFEALDCEVLSSGWPDLLIVRNGRYSGVAAVEVKNGSDKVRPNQEKMHKALKSAGIPVYVIYPKDLRAGTKHRFKKIVMIEDYNSMLEQFKSLRFDIQNWDDRCNQLLRENRALKVDLDRILNGFKATGVILESNENT